MVEPRERLLQLLQFNLDRTREDLQTPHPKNVITALSWYAQCMESQIANIQSFEINTEIS